MDTNKFKNFDANSANFRELNFTGQSREFVLIRVIRVSSFYLCLLPIIGSVSICG